ncbi:P-loop containing nucleoside triphosphate hydrolase protein [Mycotypha africana]|uniref:P-loop containing nucleoside triphosphate hydrolase protein n=1 Tax=Mycotypha africana TaxID=64632 RepID=UPI0023016EA9|nr:P-loop containing nucleoside triphosphate hydrolase protein [Mycotypha africana]KAI8987686.1 P-loop containing nucleoside triphosphate hydrolase protein [Mycotypha africana]
MSAVPNHAGSWRSLEIPLNDTILATLDNMGFETMTPVQAGAIPLFMKNKDVVVEAVTGSGKTLSFVIPILEKLLRREEPLKNYEIGAIIITPTRELAQQIHSVCQTFVDEFDDEKQEEIQSGLFIGGSNSIIDDIKSFKEQHPRILIGTPGRLDELLRAGQHLVNTKELEVLVMDEADRLLDMGFSKQLNSIIAQLPKQRRTGLFSATMTDAISELVRAGLRNPVRIVVKVEDLANKGEVQRTPTTLDIDYVVCDADQKLLQMTRILLSELQNEEDGARKFIVYFATCAMVDYFYKILSRLPQLKPFSFHSLHGQMDTKRRSLTYTSFTELSPAIPAVLLCTDVASRGLDISDLDYVIQVDPPQDPKAFSHRCGRAGRAGRKGHATVILVRGREELYIDLLKLRKIPIQRKPYIMPDLTVFDNSVQRDNSKHEMEVDEKATSVKVEDEEVMPFIQSIRAIVKTDRDISDRSLKAFVSWARSYSKHEASYIFRIKDIDLCQLAMGFGLLKLPKMPELKTQLSSEGATNKFVEEEINWDTFKYLDKQREAKRLRELKEYQEKGPQQKANSHQPKKKSVAWSEKQEAQKRKQVRKEKKQAKKEYLKRKAEEEAENKKRQMEEDVDEWEELAKEERMFKKVKKGKLDKDTFDEMFDE